MSELNGPTESTDGRESLYRQMLSALIHMSEATRDLHASAKSLGDSELAARLETLGFTIAGAVGVVAKRGR